MNRRRILALGLALPLGAPALAQGSWPERPVRLILPYAPGGATDLIARPWAEKLSQAFRQQFVIENRGGAAGMIGTEAAAKATPDGYTFLLTPSAPMTALPQMRKTPYDPVKSFLPVGRVGDLVSGYAIHPSVGIRTFPELIAYAKKNPGKLAYGSAGLGSSTHMRIEVLNMKAGVDILHVPYRGTGDALNDLLAGNIQLMNEVAPIPHVKAGKLYLLAVNHPTRHPDFPDVPTLRELGYEGCDVPSWYSIFAPAGTPKETIARLNAKMLEIGAEPEFQARMQAINVIVPLQTPEQMALHLESDTKAIGELIRAANIKLE